MRRTLAALVVAGLISAPVAGAADRLPSAVDLYARVPSYGTYGNVYYPAVGDCTVAAVADLLQTWSHAGPLKSGPFLAVYHRLVHGSGSLTAGLEVTTVLNVWKHFGIDGNRIRSWRLLGPIPSRSAVERAVVGFGALYVSVAIPNALPISGKWSLANSPASSRLLGLHAAALVGYNRTGPVIVTWGRVQQLTWGWWRVWGGVAFAIEQSTRRWKPNTTSGVVPTAITATVDSYAPTQQGSETYAINVKVARVKGATTGTVTVYDTGQPISSCDPLVMTATANGLIGTCTVTYSTATPSQHAISVSFTGDRHYAASGTIGAAIINVS